MHRVELAGEPARRAAAEVRRGHRAGALCPPLLHKAVDTCERSGEAQSSMVKTGGRMA
jgi:hypothetical protein